MDADERPSNNNRFSNRRKIKYSRRDDTAHDHAPTASTPIPQVSGTGRLWNPTGLRTAPRGVGAYLRGIITLLYEGMAFFYLTAVPLRI